MKKLRFVRHVWTWFKYSAGHKATFLRFSGGGLTISLVDIGGLYLLLMLGVQAYIGRIISYLSAMTVGYFLNRYLTFHFIKTNRILLHSLLRHYSVNSVGGVINYGIFLLVLYIGERLGNITSASSLLPLVAVSIGGFIGMFFNYIFSRKMVFDK
jgi:putative flippase GtrA